MKCYLLSSGSYSDYGVTAVFTTKEAAEAVAARHPNSELQVEERELDPGVVRAAEGLYRYRVSLDRESGDVVPYQTCESCGDADALGTVVTEQYWIPRGSTFGHVNDWPKSVEVMCWARDMNHAVKIASEQRRQILAFPAGSPSLSQEPT